MRVFFRESQKKREVISMGWLGKAVMGGIGAIVGGPLGAGIGVAIGHRIDKMGNEESRAESFEERSNGFASAFIVCYFSALAKIAKVDGVVSAVEIERVKQIMENMHLDAEDKEAAIQIFRKAKDDTTSISTYISQFGEIVTYDPEMCEMLLTSLTVIATADGELNPKELEILKRTTHLLHLPARLLDALLEELHGAGYGGEYGGDSYSDGTSLSSAYTLLQCDSSATPEEVKRAYRQRCMEFHPDKIASKGLPKEFNEFAEQQLVLINQAYEKITKSKGMK